MSRWRKLQKELMSHAMTNSKIDIIHENISVGRVYGTLYYKKKTKYTKGILLIAGLASTRYCLEILAERLAEYGYFCLAIDLPEHHFNPNHFQLGEISEEITEGVGLLKSAYGMKSVAVIGHSMGSVGALFANAGYDKRMEESIFRLWEGIMSSIEMEGELLRSKKATTPALIELNRRIEKDYLEIKQLIFQTLSRRIKRNLDVSCYILLSTPLGVNAVLPGMKILRHLNHRWVRTFVNQFFHKPALAQIRKEGYTDRYQPVEDNSIIEMQFFRIKDVYGFIDYCLAMKEPIDYLQLVEKIIEFTHEDEKMNLIEYYYRKYLTSKPKLFIFGRWDILLRPFLPFRKRKLEKFYESCGNAEIHYGSYGHVLSRNKFQNVGFMSAKDEHVTELIFRFLDKNC